MVCCDAIARAGEAIMCLIGPLLSILALSMIFFATFVYFTEVLPDVVTRYPRL